MKITSLKIAVTLATLTLITACNQKPKTDNALGDNKETATQSATSSTTTTTVTETASSVTASTSAVAPVAPVALVAPVAPAVIDPATSSTATTTTSTTASTTKAPVAISPEKAGLAKDLIAFNNAINATAVKSQKLQEAFIQKHKDDKSPDVQVLFIKEGIRSLEQQKADLKAVKLADPKAIAMRDKFISTIDQQKSAYTFMVNTPKPTQAQQEDVAKKMAEVQKTGEDAQQTFLKLAQEAGLQPQGTPQAGKN